MDYQKLQIFLPAFIIAFLGVVTWALITKKIPAALHVVSATSAIKKVRLANLIFSVLLILSLIVIIVYAYAPDYYFLTIPLDSLDKPTINTVGSIILRLSFFWIVMVQFTFVRAASFRNSADSQHRADVILYTDKLMHAGTIVMLLGLAVTLSSVLVISLLACSVIAFDRLLAGLRAV